jgi:hypothetical protein
MDMAEATSPDHSACGECCPKEDAAAPAPAARRVSEDSAQRVPECVVPPGLDFELPKGQPMDKQALAKTLWGKEFDSFEMDNAWLDRLDMGLDFGELLADLPDGVGALDDGLVPSLSDGAAAAPSAAALEQQLLAGGAAAGSDKAAQQASAAAEAALASLERQSTNEFFAALAGDYEVPSLAPAAAVPVPVPAAMPHMQHMGMVPAAAYAVPHADYSMMYVPTAMAPAMQHAAHYAPAAAPAPPRAAEQPPAKRQRRAPAAARDAASEDGEDDSDEEWCHDNEAPAAAAPAGRAGGARAGASAAAAAAAAAAALAAATSAVDNLTREQRVARYREKRKNRQFKKTIRYASRKAYAEVRPRIKGRFATKAEIASWKAAERAMAAGGAFGLDGAPAEFRGMEGLGVVPVM